MKKLHIIAFIAGLSSFIFTSCGPSENTPSVKRKDHFSLDYGSFENQINLFNLNQMGSVDTHLAMSNGFFYIANGQSQKILQMNSYGDLLTLYYNPETNPTPIFDGSAGNVMGTNSNQAVSTRKTVEYPFMTPSEIVLDSRQYIYCVETLPKERQETENNQIMRQIVLRFNSESFIDYIGQEGPGGTPFPYIRKIYTTANNCLVVVCVASEGFQIFYYNAQGVKINDLLIKYSDAPNPFEEKSGVSRHMEVENVVPASDSRHLYVKADYYETSIDNTSKVQSGISYMGSYVFPYDLVTGKYGEPIMIPPYEESISDGFGQEIYSLPYDFMGVSNDDWLFFMIPVESGYMVQMVHAGSSRVIKRLLDFDMDKVVYFDFDLSDTGIISALLATREKVSVVWWRTDSLTQAILKN